MAITAEQEKFIVKAAQVAHSLLEMLGEITAFADAGLTHTALADGIYQIAVIRNQVMTGNLPALALLAQFK